MTVRTFILAALVAIPMTGAALADDTVTLTPPLYREQARAIATVRPASELATTPRLVPASPAAPRIVAAAAPTR
ncbi:hypothetical protein MKK69_20310 [Methylobacterium sp. J-026]|uniref:hypothetical protein n=1 Tax=Methylobacterium sp. J-026 TaxID=2836624 RepID=UPI001FBB60C1|nr:hypothetical protein [Methylobacterium sp. J-026]MCJ2136364.1 hypothetical protein [Methylobacterium sp. J-026]